MTVVETEAPQKTRREILLNAAALIEEHGWTTGCEGMPGDIGHSGRLCLLGAITKAMHLEYDSSVHVVSNYVRAAEIIFGIQTELCCPVDVYEWNDDGNSAQSVTAALRRLADGIPWKEATKQ